MGYMPTSSGHLQSTVIEPPWPTTGFVEFDSLWRAGPVAYATTLRSDGVVVVPPETDTYLPVFVKGLQVYWYSGPYLEGLHPSYPDTGLWSLENHNSFAGTRAIWSQVAVTKLVGSMGPIENSFTYSSPSTYVTGSWQFGYEGGIDLTGYTYMPGQLVVGSQPPPYVYAWAWSGTNVNPTVLTTWRSGPPDLGDVAKYPFVSYGSGPFTDLAPASGVVLAVKRISSSSAVDNVYFVPLEPEDRPDVPSPSTDEPWWWAGTGYVASRAIADMPVGVWVEIPMPDSVVNGFLDGTWHSFRHAYSVVGAPEDGTVVEVTLEYGAFGAVLDTVTPDLSGALVRRLTRFDTGGAYVG